MTFSAHILTLYPDMFPGPLDCALSGKALRANLWSLKTHNIRTFALDKHHTVDDTPAGGGPGMVLRADVLAHALDSLPRETASFPRLLMSPRGRPVTQAFVRELAGHDGVTVVCGRFEGVDERVIAARNLLEVSMGDFIVSGGEIPALALLDAIIRLLPGVMGKQASAFEESFENNLLEYPHYTRPREFEGETIPDILSSGNHKAIAHWRLKKAEELTEKRRPDLWEQYRKGLSKSGQ